MRESSVTTVSLPKWPQQLGVGQTRFRNLTSLWVSHGGGRGLPGELAAWISSNIHVGCWCYGWWLKLLHHHSTNFKLNVFGHLGSLPESTAPSRDKSRVRQEDGTPFLR